MSTEKHDPWALLREAAEHMKAVAKDRGPCPDCVSCDRGLDITTRIDTALAEHEAVPSSEEKVEFTRDWHTANSPNRVEALLKDGTRVHIHKADINGTLGWTWDVEHHLQGFVLTLDEAQRAALAAARGLK